MTRRQGSIPLTSSVEDGIIQELVCLNLEHGYAVLRFRTTTVGGPLPRPVLQLIDEGRGSFVSESNWTSLMHAVLGRP